MARGTIITRTTKAGEKRYHAALWTERADGSKKQIWRTFRLRRDAEAFLDTESQSVREGDYFEPIKVTFEEFSKEWLEKYPKLSKTPLKDSTIKGYHLIIERYLKPFFGLMLVSRIRAATIEKDFKAILTTDLSARTTRNILFCLRAMLNMAVKWEYLRVNPFDSRNRQHVTLPEVSRKQSGRDLNPEEIRQLLGNSVEDAYSVVAMAVFTGMRSGEIFGLKWMT